MRKTHRERRLAVRSPAATRPVPAPTTGKSGTCCAVHVMKVKKSMFSIGTHSRGRGIPLEKSTRALCILGCDQIFLLLSSRFWGKHWYSLQTLLQPFSTVARVEVITVHLL